MPFIRVSIAGSPPSIFQRAQLQRGITDLMADVLGKHRDLTVVMVQGLAIDGCSIGGEALAEQTLAAVIEAVITEGTNTPTEKARFIRAAHELIIAVLGSVASPIYVLINEVKPGDWGYDGATQAARRAAATAL